MKKTSLLIVMLAASFLLSAQAIPYDFGSCFSKANKNSIENKIDNFKTRVSAETGCEKDKLSFTIDEYYTVFYTKPCKHLPKKITFDACGEKRTYQHNELSGSISYWLLGSWSLEKK